MNDKREVFYAKIMLFGEYSVICDSMGLTIPYAHFKGELSFINEDKYTDLEFAYESNRQLKKYSLYLQKLIDDGELIFEFDLSSFKKDIDKGLYFESSIPQGFGIGSSGALCAALYNEYGQNKIPNSRHISKKEIISLKKIFVQLESYFHGVSSGIDPLNCYLKHPIIIQGKADLSTVGIPRNKHDEKGAIFLINTGQAGMTEPLVKLFFEQCKQHSFYKSIRDEMIPFNNNCIKSLIKGETKEFFKNLRGLSKFLLKNMEPMIPETFKEIWNIGLDTSTYYLKLCGSGGGGFLLGFTEDLEKAKFELRKHNVELIPVYKNAKAIGSKNNI